MFCAQDSLAEEDSGGEPAALTAVSQYACKRRTTIDNCNKIFTVSVNNKNIKKNERKKKSLFFHTSALLPTWGNWSSEIFFSAKFCSALIWIAGDTLFGKREVSANCATVSLAPLTSHNGCVLLPSVGRCGSEARGEARPAVYTHRMRKWQLVWMSTR